MTRFKNHNGVQKVAAAAILAFALLARGNAQENTATIAGQVTDPSGALMPNVAVTAQNVLTGIARTTLTNETANYSIPLLTIGAYEVTAAKEGFKTFRQTGIVLEVGQ